MTRQQVEKLRKRIIYFKRDIYDYKCREQDIVVRDCLEKMYAKLIELDIDNHEIFYIIKEGGDDNEDLSDKE